MAKVAPGTHTIPSADGIAGAAESGAWSLTDTACSCLPHPGERRLRGRVIPLWSPMGDDHSLQFVYHRVDGEAAGLLARRELL